MIHLRMLLQENGAATKVQCWHMSWLWLPLHDDDKEEDEKEEGEEDDEKEEEEEEVEEGNE